jgi:hypothetical protein
MKDQFAHAGIVDILRQAARGGVALVQRGDGLDQMLERAAQSIQPPDDEGIASANFCQKRCQRTQVQSLKSA